MKGIRRNLKRLTYLCMSIFVFGGMLAMLIPQNVLAANETFTWATNTTINVTGGDASGTLTTVQNAPNGTNFAGTLNHNSGCQIRVQLLINGVQSNSGNLRIPESTGGNPIPNLCSQEIRSGYNRAITIQGSRPGDGGADETELQKRVNITMYSPSPASQSPQTVTFTFKNASGQTVGTTSSGQQSASNDPDPTKRVVYYATGISLEPGSYSVCPSAIVGCQNFTKVKFQSLHLTYGESLSARNVNVEVDITYTYPLGDPVNLGPLDISIQKADGTGTPITAQTDAFNKEGCDNDPTPSAECQAAGTGATASATTTLRGVFSNIDPGTYRVCVVAVNVCGNVTKANNLDADIKLTVTGQNAQDLLSGLSADEESPRCEVSGNPLTWFLCPTFNLLTGTADWLLADVLQPLLRSDPVDLDPNSDIYKIWSAFRVYGNIVLVIALIVAVFGQVIGGGVVEAYTARKMLPRILLTAILINLSIYIVALGVDISNIIGFAIGDLIIAPVRESAQFTFTPGGIETNVAAGGAVATGVIATYFAGIWAAGATAAAGTSLLTTAGVLILLFVVLPAVLALLGAFITIILLHALIFALIVVSPVAFALYCLPNTEKYFRTWWDWLFRALLVYPIIMIIFAIADVMSVAIQRANM